MFRVLYYFVVIVLIDLYGLNVKFMDEKMAWVIQKTN